MNVEPNIDMTPIVESVATEYGRRYSRYGFDRDDFAQECYLWIYQHPGKLLEWIEGDPKWADRKLARTLRNECHDAGESVKAQHLGYSLDDLYWYPKASLRTLLDAMFDEEAWTEPPVSESGPTSRRDPATGGGWIATLADVSRGFDQLKEDDRDLLIGFHREGWTNKMLAQAAHVTEQTMSYRHDQALKRLVNILGGPRPRPQHDADCTHVWRGRHAITNSHARAIVENQYDERA